MHNWGWDDIFESKKEGGTRFRRVSNIVEIAGLRLVWRLCTSQTVWSSWMQTHYLKNHHIYEAQSSLLDFGTLKWIIQSIYKALQVIENSQQAWFLHLVWPFAASGEASESGCCSSYIHCTVGCIWYCNRWMLVYERFRVQSSLALHCASSTTWCSSMNIRYLVLVLNKDIGLLLLSLNTSQKSRCSLQVLQSDLVSQS